MMSLFQFSKSSSEYDKIVLKIIFNSCFFYRTVSSFFQRQFFSGIKLFRNFISFQGIIADAVLKNLAISSLLNRYLLSAMRVSNPNEGISKAQTLVLTLPRIWLVTADKNFIDMMNLFVMYVASLEGQLDRKSPMYADGIERLKQILGRLDLMVSS